jgi:hypothetical protein
MDDGLDGHPTVKRFKAADNQVRLADVLHAPPLNDFLSGAEGPAQTASPRA